MPGSEVSEYAQRCASVMVASYAILALVGIFAAYRRKLPWRCVEYVHHDYDETTLWIVRQQCSGVARRNIVLHWVTTDRYIAEKRLNLKL